LTEYIRKVYQSLYSEKAFYDRQRVSMDETSVWPAVIIQHMVSSEYSFVIHTKDPSNGNDDIVIELTPGLGEALVSGKKVYQGTPFKFNYNKKDGSVKILSYCNKSLRMYSYGKSGTRHTRVDYTEDDLTLNYMNDEWQGLLKELAGIAIEKEEYYGFPQDIEGAIEKTEKGRIINILQARVQKIKSGGMEEERKIEVLYHEFFEYVKSLDTADMEEAVKKKIESMCIQYSLEMDPAALTKKDAAIWGLVQLKSTVNTIYGKVLPLIKNSTLLENEKFQLKLIIETLFRISLDKF
jgi:phosphoenolpyruvate synthase/pyruvate phosphate dikinase